MLSIVYQDNDLLILDKPAGMLTVPGTFSNVNLLDLAVSQYLIAGLFTVSTWTHPD